MFRQRTAGSKKNYASNQVMKLMVHLSNALFRLFGLELSMSYVGKVKCNTLTGMNGPLCKRGFADASSRKKLYQVTFHHQKLMDRLILFYHRSKSTNLRRGQLEEHQLLEIIQQKLGGELQLEHVWFADLLIQSPNPTDQD